MNYKYIIKAEGQIAFPVHSDFDLSEIQEYIKTHSKKLHPKGHDVSLTIGANEYINPVVMMVNEFANFAPLLIGLK